MATTEHQRVYHKEIVYAGRRIGQPTLSMFNAGGADLMAWLAKVTPEGATISDTLAAIAVDAMYEENP